MLLILGEVRAVFLKALLHTVLENMQERLLGEELRSPRDVLLTPGDSQIGAHHAPNFIPILSSQDMQAQVTAHHFDLLKESHAGLTAFNVHFGARSYQDDPAHIFIQS